MTANCFAEAYASSPVSSIIEASGPQIQLTAIFNSVCSGIINDVAPLKLQSQPWFNNETHALRQACRKAERRWKTDKLQVSYEMLKDTLSIYQNSALPQNSV